MTQRSSVIDEYLAHLSVERGLAANSLQAYRRDLARYNEFLAQRQLGIEDVSVSDVGAYIDLVRTGTDGRASLAPSSTARMLAAVRGLHKFAVFEGIAVTNPADEVLPPSQPDRLPKALTTDQVSKILDASGAGEGPAPLRNRALLELLYSCGARISEAVNLDIDDVDLTRGSAAVRLFGKGSKERIVPVGSYAVGALEAYLVRGRSLYSRAGKGTPAMFLNVRGTRLSRQSAWSILGAAAEKADLPAEISVSPHTLRHSCATHLLQGGADIRVVQELLGHASVTTTQIYTRVTPDHLREVYLTAHPRARTQ